jgi:hypothetical protein
MRVCWAIMGATLFLSVVPARADFIAFNDCAAVSSGQTAIGNATPANTTLYGMGWSLWTGHLKDFATGASQTATVEVKNNGAQGPPTGGDAGAVKMNAGTDGGDLFNSTIDCRAGAMYYATSGAWSVDLLFTNLNPAKKYTLATTLDRGNSSYNNRWTVISILDADASVYASSAGAFKVSNTATSIESYNTVNGYIAKWTDIQPGADGDFTIHFTYAVIQGVDYPTGGVAQNGNKGYGPAGFMLAEVPEPVSLSLLAIGALGLLAARRRASR